MSSSLFQIDIPRRQNVCSHNGERLEFEKEIYSLLKEKEDSQTMTRHDYCVNCWHQLFPHSEEISERLYWKTRIEKKTAPLPSTRLERALQLLQNLVQTSPESESEIFVLCLLLAHGRQLTLRKEFKKDGLSFHLYEIPKQNSFITVKVIDLKADQIVLLQNSLSSKLNRTPYDNISL